MLQDKKQEVTSREENLRVVRGDLEKDRGELEELRARVKALKRRRKEMLEELEEAQQVNRKAQKDRIDAEDLWRSRVEEVKEQQEAKMIALITEIQMLMDREQKRDNEWRSRVEETDLKAEQNQTEVTWLRAVVDMLEEQKTQISSQAEEQEPEVQQLGERLKEREGTDRPRRERRRRKETNDESEGGGEVRKNLSYNLNKK